MTHADGKVLEALERLALSALNTHIAAKSLLRSYKQHLRRRCDHRHPSGESAMGLSPGYRLDVCVLCGFSPQLDGSPLESQTTDGPTEVPSGEAHDRTGDTP